MVSGITLALGCGIAFHTLAQTNPNQLIAQRKGAMNLQAKYLGPLLGMALGKIPYDAGTSLRNADYLAVLTQLPWDDFQPSTASQPEGRTRAKDEIYNESGKFKAKSDELRTAVQKLTSAAHAGNKDAANAAALDVGRACNSCHESYATFQFRFKVE
jgi:cytochrome c556